MSEGDILKHIALYGNGEALSYVECGDKNGFPILIQHGLIASIDDVALFDRLVELGARLISIARPGYGESSPYVMKNMAGWADIVSVLVDALQLSSFDVFGISSGAPYSYALGYRFPGKVRNIFILSGTPALYDDAVLSLWPYPVDRNATIADLQKLAYELFFAGLQKDAMAQSDVRDSMMNNCFGIAQDLRLRCRDWGFSLSDVTQNVYMRHSRSDGSGPFLTAEMTAKLLPRCRIEAKEHDAHFSKDVLDDYIRTVMAGHDQ